MAKVALPNKQVQRVEERKTNRQSSVGKNEEHGTLRFR